MVGEDYLVLSQQLIVYMGIVTTGISTLVAKFQRLKQTKKNLLFASAKTNIEIE